MGEVTRYRKRHWTGLDADLASVPNPSIGDTYLATDKNKLYYKTTSGWKTGLGYEYVGKRTATFDKDITDFVTDGTWKVDGLDLSAIVPAGAVAVILRVTVLDDAASSLFSIRPNATDAGNAIGIFTQVANVQMEHPGAILPIDSNRLMDYQGTNLVFTGIWLTVIGWFI